MEEIRCAENGGCPFRFDGSGCSIADGVDVRELMLLVEYCAKAHERTRTVACVIWRRLLLPALRHLTLPGSTTPITEFEALEEAYLVACRLRRRTKPGALPILPLPYVATMLRNHAIDVQRHHLGRHRCGTCRHFIRRGGLCSRPHAPYPHGIPAQQKPRELDPPCHSYSWLRKPSQVRDIPEKRDDDDAGRVMRALERLEDVHPASATLVRRQYLDGMASREIARRCDLSSYQTKRLLRKARFRLRQVIEDTP